MTKLEAERAKVLIEQINELNKYKTLFNNLHGNHAHVEFVQHYGNVSGSEKIVFHTKYNKKFLPVFDEILAELEKELEAI